MTLFNGRYAKKEYEELLTKFVFCYIGAELAEYKKFVKNSKDFIYEYTLSVNQELAVILRSTQDRISSLVNYLSIVIGMFISISILIYQQNVLEISLIPFFFAIGLLMVGIFIGLIALFPTKYQFAMDPESLKKYEEVDVEDTKKDIIETINWMIYKNTKVIAKKTHLIQIILMLTLSSFIMIGLGELAYIVNAGYEIPLMLISSIAFMILIITYYFVKKGGFKWEKAMRKKMKRSK